MKVFTFVTQFVKSDAQSCTKENIDGDHLLFKPSIHTNMGLSQSGRGGDSRMLTKKSLVSEALLSFDQQ